MERSVCFKINGVSHKVAGGEPWLSLADYIRDVAGLKGTKLMCREGGCSACAIVVTKYSDGAEKSHVINSCICPVYLADGWAITTVERLGNRKAGYHPIQTRLADYNASQCGFCTPGIAMRLYGTLKNCTNPCKNDLEKSLDGHVCRCTGYRSVLDAVNFFASDSEETSTDPLDIEDLCKLPCSQASVPNRIGAQGNLTLKLKGGKTWHKVTYLTDLLQIQKQQRDKTSVRMVIGMTSLGVFRSDIDAAQVLVEISSVPELRVTEMNEDLVLGAGHSLTSLCNIFTKTAKDNPQFSYLHELSGMVKKVANDSIRNIGSWAGNLMLQYNHPNFPSDISVILEAAGARLEICDEKNVRFQLSLQEFWKENMTGKLILSMRISPTSNLTVFRAYKVTPRYSNSYALINAAFKVELGNDRHSLQGAPSLVFGCVGGRYVHAQKTEEYLKGRSLKDKQTLSEALRLLKTEINPPAHPMATSPEYRRDVAVALLYKFILETLGNDVPSHLRCGACPLERPLSRGQQDYQVMDELLGTSVPKKGIIRQTSGETRFLADIPRQEGEVHAAFVLSSIGKGSIDTIDTSQALNFPGVLTVLAANDLAPVSSDNDTEKVLSDGKIEFMHEPVAMVIAENQLTADLAASHVKVTYKDIQMPIMDLYQAIEKNSTFPNSYPPVTVGDAEGELEKCDHIFEGEVKLGIQNHFSMETQACLCVPHENTMDVWSSTQMVRNVQTAIAKATGRPMHSVHVTVPAIGGGFGGKLTNGPIVGVPVAMAAEVLNKPVRMVMCLRDNLKTAMKRIPMLFKYKAGVKNDGRIKSVITDIYLDLGKAAAARVNTYFSSLVMKSVSGGENVLEVTSTSMRLLSGAYAIPNWMVRSHLMKTDHRETCAMRAPGMSCRTAELMFFKTIFPATFFIETLMEHVAKELSHDPLDMRMMHLRQPGEVCLYGRPDTGGSMSRIWGELRETSNYEKRKIQIQEYNKKNQWRKRGISVVPAVYQITYNRFNFSCFLAVYADDGSVAVSHGGVEMGQGVDTKVCQAVAQTFRVPLDLVHCQQTNSLTGANCSASVASVTSEICVKAAVEACKIIQTRMAPVREQNPGATWTEIVSLCHEARIDLTAEYRCFPPEAFPYKTYGMCVAEAEVDILTGLYQINRVDILMDLGLSMNPMLDVGQIEGAFVMGMGYMLMEKEIIDPKTGRILSDSTQSYKVPMTQDIPIDFRVSLLKDSTNVHGVTKSRAVGEPPICLAPSVLFAIRAAIEDSREQRGYKPKFLRVDAPMTVEQVQRLAEVNIDQLTLE